MDSEFVGSMMAVAGKETGRRELMAAAFAGAAASAVLFQAVPAGASTEVTSGTFGPYAGPQIAMTCTLLEMLFPGDQEFAMLQNGVPEAMAKIRTLVHFGAGAEKFTDRQIREFLAQSDEVEHVVVPLAAEMAVHPLTFVKGAPGSSPSGEEPNSNTPSLACVLAFNKCIVEASETLTQLMGKCPTPGSTWPKKLLHASCLLTSSVMYAVMLASCHHDLQNC